MLEDLFYHIIESGALPVAIPELANFPRLCPGTCVSSGVLAGAGTRVINRAL